MNDHWTIYAVGFLAQLLFSGRTLHQWLKSEKKEKVVTPTLFWTLGIAAAFILFVYGYLRDDFAILVGQFLMYYIYIRNLQIRGVWKSYHTWFKWILLWTPLLFIGVVAYLEAYDVEALFKNESIPIWLLVTGTVGQVVYTLRFVYQWLYAEKENKSTLPLGFWWLSLIGSIIIVVYGLYRKDPVLVVGHFFGTIVYIRNMILIERR